MSLGNRKRPVWLGRRQQSELRQGLFRPRQETGFSFKGDRNCWRVRKERGMLCYLFLQHPPAAIREMGKGTGLSEEQLTSGKCVALQLLLAQPASIIMMVSIFAGAERPLSPRSSQGLWVVKDSWKGAWIRLRAGPQRVLSAASSSFAGVSLRQMLSGPALPLCSCQQGWRQEEPLLWADSLG